MLCVVELLMFLADAGIVNSLPMHASVLLMPKFMLKWQEMEGPLL